MDTGCHTLVNDFDDLKLTLKNPRDDDNDSNSDIDDGFDGAEEGLGPDDFVDEWDDDDDSNSDSDDGFDGEEEGLGPDVLQRKLKDPMDDNFDDDWDDDFDDESNSDIGIDEAELAAAEEDLRLDVLPPPKPVPPEPSKPAGRADVGLGAVQAELMAAIKKSNLSNHHEAELAAAEEDLGPYVLSSPPAPAPAGVDVGLGAVQADLMAAMNRSEPVHWIDLYCAINKGNVHALTTGLNRGNKELLWRQDSQGETLLHASVKAAGKGPLRKLVRHMTSNRVTEAAYLANYNGDTALHLAVKSGDLDASNCLMKVEPKTVYQVNCKGVSPLYMAVKAGNHELIKSMVSYCCLRDHASEILSKPNHDTLAHLAIDARSFGIFKVLMEHLPTLGKAKNENGLRLLSYAAYKGSLDEVTYILTNFPEYAEKYDNDDSLPIHKAGGGGQVSVVEAFLEHCPQALHHVSKNGRSVLHIAAINDKTEIITYLKEKVKMDESFLNLKDNNGKTFMDYAKDRKQ